MVEPAKGSRARNLLSKHDWRTALADEPKPRRPEMTGIVEAATLPRGTEGLAGTRPCPNSPICPAGEIKSVIPPADAGEEVAAVVTGEVSGLHVSNVALVNEPRGDEADRHESSKPVGRKGIKFIVVGIHSGPNLRRIVASVKHR
jgi:hypothetical protein